MPWLLSFIVSWIVFLILVDYKELKKYIWSGVLSLILATIVDWGGMNLQLYIFRDVIIPWFGCSVFYKFGPIFTMGILFSQYLPRDKYHQVYHIIAFTILFLITEHTISQTHAADYVHWSLAASALTDIFAYCTLSWFTIVFIRKQ